jgi:hypothetical protein
MSVTAKELVPARQIENVQTAQYTAQNVRAIIDKATVTNTSVANVALSVNLIPPAGTAGNGNLIIKTKTILPGETYNCPELVGHVLDPGGVISTLAGAATALTFRVSGREVA